MAKSTRRKSRPKNLSPLIAATLLVDSGAVESLKGNARAQQIVLRVSLSSLQRKFNDTRDPALAWEARYLSRLAGAPEPEWVTACIDQFAARMHAMCSTEMPEGRPQLAVYLAHGFNPGRRNNPFRAIVQEDHRVLMAVQVLELVEEKWNPDAAIFKVAGGKRRYSTVERAWNRYGLRLQELKKFIDHAKLILVSINCVIADFKAQIAALRAGEAPTERQFKNITAALVAEKLLIDALVSGPSIDALADAQLAVTNVDSWLQMT